MKKRNDETIITILDAPENNQLIYEMRLHEIKIFQDVRILRVAGGWIYRIPKGNDVFVPINDELKE